MKKFTEFINRLWNTTRWFKFLVLMLPFTGIINPSWFGILLFIYFISVAYIVTDIKPIDKSKYVSPYGGRWQDDDKPTPPPVEHRDDDLSDPHVGGEDADYPNTDPR